MVREETRGNIYLNTHILDVLASSKSYKEVVVTNTHWELTDSECFRGEKAIQNPGHVTKIRLWHSVTAPWMSALAQHSPGIQDAFGSRGHDGILLSQDRKGWELCYHFISDWWMLVRRICLLCWKLMRRRTPGVYTDPFTRLCHTRLFHEYQPCCVTLAIPVWQETDPDLPAGCHRHRHSKHTGQAPHQLQQQHWDNAASRAHSSDRTSLTKTRAHLWWNNFYLTSITKMQAMTWLNSPQHTYQHPFCFIWGGWLRSMPSANSRVRHCTASPELAEAGMCSKLEAELQWHLTNDPMQGALLLFPRRYPDWQGARNLKNRCLGLLCYYVFNGFSQERRWKGQALRLGPAPAARFHSWRTPHKARPHAPMRSWAQPLQTGSHISNRQWKFYSRLQHHSYQLLENSGLLFSLLN